MATVPEKKKAGGHGLLPCGPSTHPGSLASCFTSALMVLEEGSSLSLGSLSILL